jgi:hypothetical protein
VRNDRVQRIWRREARRSRPNRNRAGGAGSTMGRAAASRLCLKPWRLSG